MIDWHKIPPMMSASFDLRDVDSLPRDRPILLLGKWRTDHGEEIMVIAHWSHMSSGNQQIKTNTEDFYVLLTPISKIAVDWTHWAEQPKYVEISDQQIAVCPFCGSPAEVRHDTSSDYKSKWSYAVHCMDPRWWTQHQDAANACAVSGPDRKTAEEAIAAWNQSSMD